MTRETKAEATTLETGTLIEIVLDALSYFEGEGPSVTTLAELVAPTARVAERTLEDGAATVKTWRGDEWLRAMTADDPRDHSLFLHARGRSGVATKSSANVRVTCEAFVARAGAVVDEQRVGYAFEVRLLEGRPRIVRLEIDRTS